MIRCPNCDMEFAESSAPDFCPACSARVRDPDTWYAQGEFDEAPGLPVDSYCPWEDADLPLLNRFTQTVTGILFRPQEFFSRLPACGFGRALLFALVICLIVQSVQFAGSRMLSSAAGFHSGGPFMFSWYAAGSLVSIVLTLIFLGLFVLVYGIISHGVASLFGASASPETSIRVIAYCQVVSLFNLIPIIGVFIAFIWFLVAASIGLRETQRISLGGAILSVFAPSLMCFGGVLIFFLLVFNMR